MIRRPARPDYTMFPGVSAISRGSCGAVISGSIFKYDNVKFKTFDSFNNANAMEICDREINIYKELESFQGAVVIDTSSEGSGDFVIGHAYTVDGELKDVETTNTPNSSNETTNNPSSPWRLPSGGDFAIGLAYTVEGKVRAVETTTNHSSATETTTNPNAQTHRTIATPRSRQSSVGARETASVIPS